MLSDGNLVGREGDCVVLGRECFFMLIMCFAWNGFGEQWLCGMFFLLLTRVVVRWDVLSGGMFFVWWDVLFGGECCRAVVCPFYVFLFVWRDVPIGCIVVLICGVSLFGGCICMVRCFVLSSEGLCCFVFFFVWWDVLSGCHVLSVWAVDCSVL